MSEAAGPGLALETATEHVEVAVMGAEGAVLAHVVENVGHGHTRRLSALVDQALGVAGPKARELAYLACDLGPGSFTGVRVGLATAKAIALVAGARLRGVSSLAALAHGLAARRAVIVPLVGAGRRDLYAGFYRCDARGRVRLLAAPRVGTPEELIAAAAEAHALVPGDTLRFIGPGAGRETEKLERAFPTSTALAFRHDGLSALDVAHAALLPLGPGAGLPAPGREGEPVYVRPAQAEERVRHRIAGSLPVTVRDFQIADLPAVLELEARLFSDPWSPGMFVSALGNATSLVRVAERGGALAGYLVATTAPPVSELQNLATAPEHQRFGVARALLEDLFQVCVARDLRTITLEVRASNTPAQVLYRTHGFRLAGLRRSYYQAPDEDALVMTRRVG